MTLRSSFSICCVTSALVCCVNCGYGAENVVLSFQKEKMEILKMVPECGLTTSSPISVVQTASGNSYLLSLGCATSSDDSSTSNIAAKTVAHSKALREISQFIKTEVQSENSVKELTTIRAVTGEDKTKKTERVRTDIITIRSQAIISQAMILESRYDKETHAMHVILAMRLADKT